MTETLQPTVVAEDVELLPEVEAGPHRRPARAGREPWWWLPLLGITMVGLGVRIGWVLSTPHLRLWGDACYYHFQANLLAQGHGFENIVDCVRGTGSGASAYHPPLWTLYLSVWSLAGLKSWTAHRLAGCFLGGLTIVVVGTVGRRLGGRWVGLAAAALAAAYPLVWINDGIGLSESMVLLMVALVLLAAYRLVEQPTLPRAAVLGGVCGLAALTRTEQLLLVPVLAGPVIFLLRRRGVRQRASLFLVCGMAAATVLAPWVGRNLVTFHHPVILSTNIEPTLATTYCPATFDRQGVFFAYWDMKCLAPGARGDESDISLVQRHQALTFAGEHKRELPAVMVARVGRLWALFRPGQTISFDQYESRPLWVSRLGLVMFASLVPVAIAGAVALWRRRVALAPLMALPVVVTISAALTYGNTRFRAPAEITIVLLAAVAFEAIVTRTWPAPRPAAAAPRGMSPGQPAAVVERRDEAAVATPGGRFPCFDGFRALAALAVVGVHTTFVSSYTLRHHSIGNFTSRLDIGVAVFFLISGFLLYRPFVAAHLAGRPGAALRPYFRRRVVRIVPAYWFALTMIAFVLHDVQIHTIKAAVIYYGFLQIYAPNYLFHGITQAWSLCTEISFYIFLPLWAVLMSGIARRRRANAANTFAVEMLGVVALYLSGFAFRYLILVGLVRHPGLRVAALDWLPPNLDLFALGMGLAVISAWAAQRQADPTWERRATAAGRRPWLWWVAAAVCYWAVATRLALPRDLGPLTNNQWLGREVLYGLFALCFLVPGVFGPQRRGLIRGLLRNRVVQVLGLVSYGIYLWHEAIITEFYKHTHYAYFSGHVRALVAYTLAGTIAAAGVSWFLVEKPALRLKGKP